MTVETNKLHFGTTSISFALALGLFLQETQRHFVPFLCGFVCCFHRTWILFLPCHRRRTEDLLVPPPGRIVWDSLDSYLYICQVSQANYKPGLTLPATTRKAASNLLPIAAAASRVSFLAALSLQISVKSVAKETRAMDPPKTKTITKWSST